MGIAPTKKSDDLLLAEFLKLYPNPRSELHFEGEFQLLVAVVLSAQCTDKKVNEVTPLLFARYPSSRELSRARVVALEEILRQVNYYRTKARNLLALAKMLEDDFGGKVPRSYDELRRLPGVGNKTANVVLSELGITATFPVDTHVFRVSQRLGLATGKTPEAIEMQLRKRFEASWWRPLHHWLIFHGRRVCRARNPLCLTCALGPTCPSYRKGDV